MFAPISRSSFRRFTAVALVAVTLAGCDSKPPAPGQNEFNTANGKITVYESQVGFGSDAAATKAATTFAKRIKALEAESFSGGKDMNTATTQGHWLTYCKADAKGATFLVRAPNLETYEGEDRELLLDLAWSAANDAAASLTSKPSTVTVGIRGKLPYGGYATGALGPKPTTRKTGTSVDMAPLYAGFAETK